MRDVFLDHYGDLRIGWLMLVVVTGIGVTLAGFMAAGLHFVDRPACFHKAEALDVDARWGIWTGCLVADDEGRWFPLDQFREVR